MAHTYYFPDLEKSSKARIMIYKGFLQFVFWKVSSFQDAGLLVEANNPVYRLTKDLWI